MEQADAATEAEQPEAETNDSQLCYKPFQSQGIVTLSH
jgi:hypothetical protein